MSAKKEPLNPVLPIIPGEDFWSVLICACRYCLGRQTYMPSTVTEWIMENCEGRMTEKTIYVMLKDIHDKREIGGQKSLGADIDIETWERLEPRLQEQKLRLNNNDDDPK